MEKYLQQLIARRTVTADQQANQDGLDYLENFFAAHGLHCVRRTFAGYGTLVATTQKNDLSPTVMLAAHLDVVPGADEVFTLEEEGGKYFGRGVFDMKFSIACFMALLDQLGQDIKDYSLGIMITCDEEIGGFYGVSPLMNLGYRPKVMVLPDGSKDWQIETFAKGVIHGTIHVRGRAAHGSMPWEGDSATFKLVDLLQELKRHFDGQTLNTNTLNIGPLQGGKVINQVPERASAGLDIRYMAPSDRGILMAVITDLCDRYDATFDEIEVSGNPCINELTNPMIAPFVESIKTVTGVTARGLVSHGGSDARYLTPLKIPAIICRPPGGGQHANAEWIDKKGAHQYIDVLIDYLNKVAR